MQHLLIEQKGPSGLLKTWRLRAEQGRATFGNSKHADLISPIDTIKGIQGLFELRDDGFWYYINLDFSSHHQSFETNKIEARLDKIMDLAMGASTLSITPYDARAPLFHGIDSKDIFIKDQNKMQMHLFAVYQGSSLLEVKTIGLKKTFTSKFDPGKTKFNPSLLDDWKKTKINDLEIHERTIYVHSVSKFRGISKDQFFDDTSKNVLLGIFGVSFIFACILFLSPKKQSGVNEALHTNPATQYKEIQLEPPKKRKVVEKPVQQKASGVNQGQTQAAAKGDAGQNSPSTIKSFAAGRISQLIGKISAGAAKSENLVKGAGVAAGSAPTGRALAALGSTNRDGKDWSSEGKGTGVVVSTKGLVGGEGLGGVGKLAAGKTGAGGIGLLEDESEITGGLDREIIASYIKSQLGQILYCYERQLSARPDLFGKVSVRFTIAASGQVEAQSISDSSLKDKIVESCILQRIGKWKFPNPDGGTKVLVTYPFLFKSTN